MSKRSAAEAAGLPSAGGRWRAGLDEGPSGRDGGAPAGRRAIVLLRASEVDLHGHLGEPRRVNQRRPQPTRTVGAIYRLHRVGVQDVEQVEAKQRPRTPKSQDLRHAEIELVERVG